MPIDIEGITDLSEKGAVKDGVRQSMDRRLFIQLLVFGGSVDSSALIEALKESGFSSVLYEDINDPRGVALLTMSEDPGFFATGLRGLLGRREFASLELKGEYTMLGRTYALGHEEKLEEWLLHRAKKVVTNPEWKWAVWYPLRRSGAFALLPPKEQGEILMEHGMIGRAFGKADLGHDIRLSCYGLDKNDNDFVIGLIGKELHPLSALVQTMRKTKQTSTYIDRMGPFFIGRAVWQSAP
ncbi:MAG: chlorite dismutase family protein [Deltaproteobacteria bacterium]|nr:chlorite dismutase family protein [Deltaproteobacteria bacterium]